MTLQLVPRKNGRDMTTIKAAHHVGSVELARLLCQHAHDHRPVPYTVDPEPGKDMNRGQVEELLRQRVWEFGQEAYDGEGFGEDDPLEGCVAITTWAAGQVRRLFPALADTALDVWERQWHDEIAKARQRRADMLAGR